MTFGDKLKAIRAKFNLSQEQLADKLLVSRQTITKWETNAVLPDAMHLKDLAKMFGVTTDFLLNTQNELPLLALTEEINLESYQKKADEKGMSKAESYVRERFGAEYTIYPLIRSKKMTIGEHILDFLIQPGTIELADGFSDMSQYFLIERNEVQFLVNVTKEKLIVSELSKRFEGSRMVIGNNRFRRYLPKNKTRDRLLAILMAISTVGVLVWAMFFANVK
ncbi:MAG: helix-turn-helix domain-containing protein [Candidatus Nanosyncoccaceae bacterium]|jgi:transcriptional regulator with XRE-family HTH domain